MREERHLNGVAGISLPETGEFTAILPYATSDASPVPSAYKAPVFGRALAPLQWVPRPRRKVTVMSPDNSLVRPLPDRIPLQSGDKLGLMYNPEDNPQECHRFTILKELKPWGESSIAYLAERANASGLEDGVGILKEFYPSDFEKYSLHRDADTLQLAPEEASRHFGQAIDEYLEPYRLMKKKRDESNKEGAEAQLDFIPYFEIYQGSPVALSSGSTYIWMPDAPVMTLGEYCDNLDPRKQPEYDFVLILNAIKHLSDCIQRLHSYKNDEGQNLLHGNIAPSNFGFRCDAKSWGRTFQREIRPDTLVLYDLDSVHFLGSPTRHYSLEYAAPEVIAQTGESVQSDIYSIGATLLDALLRSNSNRCSKPSEIGDAGAEVYVKNLLPEMELLHCSEVNNHPRVHEMLSGILSKCLDHNPQQRYRSCNDLSHDLVELLDYLTLNEYGTCTTRELFEKLRATLDQDTVSSISTLRRLLFYNPLYNWIDEETQKLSILVVGFGKYSQNFLDLALQLGQIPGIKLDARVISNNAKGDRHLYERERPAFNEFFNVGGPETDIPDIVHDDNYGTVTFYQKDALGLTAESLQTHHQPGYVFVALGSDGDNETVANTCAEAFGKSSVSYIVEHGETSAHDGSDSWHLVPVFPHLQHNAWEDSDKDRGLIERMAFNAHLLWEKGADQNINDIFEKRFRGDNYNYDSCLATAVAVRYKIYGALGEDLQDDDALTRANEFNLWLTEKDDAGNLVYDNEIIQLIYYEHRRWVVSKVCQRNGFARLNLAEIKPGDDAWKAVMSGASRCGRKHLCICPSRQDSQLDSHEVWDTLLENEIDGLDELDKLSVLLHRTLLKEAESKISPDNCSWRTTLDSIGSDVENDPASRNAFFEFQSNVLEICDDVRVDGRRGAYRRYESLRDELSSRVEASQLVPGVKALAKNHIEMFDKDFYPIRAAREYRDFKLEDVKLIEGIPFILTYSRHIALIVPHDYGANAPSVDQAFSTIASSTIVDPERVILVCLAPETDAEKKSLVSSLLMLARYADHKNLQAKFSVALLRIGNDADQPLNDNNPQDLENKSSGRIAREDIRHFNQGAAEAWNGLPDALKNMAPGSDLTSIEVNDTPAWAAIKDAFAQPELQLHLFDPNTMKFNYATCQIDVGWAPDPERDAHPFNSIIPKRFLTVDDMLALKYDGNESIKSPEYQIRNSSAECFELWDIYREHPGSWKSLCTALRELDDDEVVFRKSIRGPYTERTYHASVRKSFRLSCLLEGLMREGFISSFSMRRSRNPDDLVEADIGTEYDDVDKQLETLISLVEKYNHNDFHATNNAQDACTIVFSDPSNTNDPETKSVTLNKNAVKQRTYFAPHFCFRSLTKILSQLLAKKYIAAYCIKSFSNFADEIEINSEYGSVIGALDNLLKRPRYLANTSQFHIPYSVLRRDGQNETVGTALHVVFDTLQVGHENSPDSLIESGLGKERVFNVLKALEREHCITCLKKTGDEVSFTYATDEIRELLSKEGTLLESYVYHAARKSLLFDDVKGGVVWYQRQDMAGNEYDCILTKGLTSLFVECKARVNLGGQQEYEKIYNDHRNRIYALGANAVGVMVLDTLNDEGTLSLPTYRNTGKNKGIVTISIDSAKQHLNKDGLRTHLTSDVLHGTGGFSVNPGNLIDALGLLLDVDVRKNLLAK